MSKLVPVLIVLYFVVATVVFGYTYNVDYEYTTYGWTGQQIHRDPTDNAMRSFMTALVWPLYVSEKIFESRRPPEK